VGGAEAPSLAFQRREAACETLSSMVASAPSMICAARVRSAMFLIPALAKKVWWLPTA